MAFDKTVIVIGSGFGGTMTALSLGRAMKARAKGETIHILERGTWWTTPVGTVQDLEVRTPEFLLSKGQPVQFWPAVDHFKGLIDVFLRCLRRKGNEDGLYDITTFGELGLFGRLKKSDGISIVHASGVGGGSLLYSNVTIRPPEFLFEDQRWKGAMNWTPADRDRYYTLAANAIGYGVLSALDGPTATAPGVTSVAPVNTGLSNIVTRSAGLPQGFASAPTAAGLKQIDPTKENGFWIDRARVFQATVASITRDFGTVNSSINDLPPASVPWGKAGTSPAVKNYCQRQGRCTVGCLPGARHTLNKQLMRAIFGGVGNQTTGETPSAPPSSADLPGILSLEALAEVDFVEALPGGGYRVHYQVRDRDEPWRTTPKAMTAQKVILAAGCVGTVELLFRSRTRGLANLSDRLGSGFSTNGDYIGFVDETKSRIRLTKGPVTTSYAHFHTPAADPAGANPELFHTVEDNGIPPALASTVGFGIPLIRKVAAGKRSRLLILWIMANWLVFRGWHYLVAFFRNARKRQPEFRSEDEFTDRMMCVTAFGRAAADGQFRPGGSDDTALRVMRENGKGFHEDTIYKEMDTTLRKLAEAFTGRAGAEFTNPFVSTASAALKAKSLMVTHPLGGATIGKDATQGTVDEFGRVFDKSRTGERAFYAGLYVVDAAIIPTSLGVNPSLTISALALRVADQIAKEL